ncbi:MAG: YlmC/YmxH family sporulation protein [Ruminococcaceae bacterium]|nr:YlmC/YmxH family sporulation protein [Oscillospiraceae bacterium]
MQRCNSEDFREKEVVNVCDGKKLGCVSEVEFNVCDGKLTAIIVPVEGGFLGLGNKGRIVIPWDKIVRIGEDVILVNAEGLLPLPDKKKRK